MPLRVYNTLTNQKEDFVPREPGKVSIYVCGVTPYNHPHLGNARPFLTWDVIRRYFAFLGYQVSHIQNFTDVDDKIINTANAEGVIWDVIANRYIASYFEVMDKLNIQRADNYPKVSGHMGEIVEMIQTLVNKGVAYVVDGDVYYAVTKFADYGKLSGRTLDDMKAGARIEVDERKTHPMDFALWKAAKPGEPSWDSPWGKGRPGWHIECSAMSLKYLGNSFDFHGGGSDLIFPHHENEIAQSEACTGHEPFVRYWLHNGFITIDQEKMSKSLGNFFLVKDILDKYAPAVLRFLILSTHYRSPLDFSDERLKEAARSFERLQNAARLLEQVLAKAEDRAFNDQDNALIAAATKAKQDFLAAMDDDFNTALAIASLFELAKELNGYNNAALSGSHVANAKALGQVKEIYNQLLEDILGLPLSSEATADSGTVDALMNLIVDIRQKARAAKDYQTADHIRNALGAIGVVLEDTPQGVRWKQK